jgi:hypothetical protein
MRSPFTTSVLIGSLLCTVAARAEEQAPATEPAPAPPAEPAPAPAAEPAPAAATEPAAPAPAAEPAAEPPAVPAKPDEAAKDPDYRTGLGFAGLPLLNFNSDEGVGYGLRLAVYDYADNQKPYRYALIGQFFQTTNWVMSHRLIFDAPKFLGTRWRLDGELRLNADKFSPWYGTGNDATFVPAYIECEDRTGLKTNPDVCADKDGPGAGADPNPDFRGLRYYNYESVTPLLIFNVRGDLSGPWKAFGGYRFRMTFLKTRYTLEDLGQTTPSKLQEDLAAGVPPVVNALGQDNAGASYLPPRRNAELVAGIVYDSRDNEPAPTSGMFHDIALVGAGPILGGEFWYGGVTSVLRFYQHMDDEKRFVLTMRVLLDAKFGDVPFYMFPYVPSIKDISNSGGAESIRGVLKNRLQGKIKLYLTPELRWTFLIVRPWGQRIDMGLVGAIDVGRVWADAANLGDFVPDFRAFKAGANLGFRIALNENFLVRVDYARALNDPSGGLYITFDHMY